MGFFRTFVPELAYPSVQEIHYTFETYIFMTAYKANRV
jgi:hypothetical protein